MTWTIPDQGEPANDLQSELFQSSLDALAAGHARTGVISGCAVTAQASPDMTVAVAAGTVSLANVQAAVTAGNVTIGTADGTNPRLDLVVSDGSGTKSVIAGTAAAAPKEATLDTTTYVLLAQVYVPAAATTITTARITDRRVILGGTVSKIAETVLAGTAASITFSSIPGTYRSLRVVISGRSNDSATSQVLLLRVNGDTGNNYHWQSLYGTGSTTGAISGAGNNSVRCARVPGAGAPASYKSQAALLIHNYADTTFFKALAGQAWATDSSTTLLMENFSGLWLSTAAITSLVLFPTVGSFIAGTVATLYGEA